MSDKPKCEKCQDTGRVACPHLLRGGLCAADPDSGGSGAICTKGDDGGADINCTIPCPECQREPCEHHEGEPVPRGFNCGNDCPDGASLDCTVPAPDDDRSCLNCGRFYTGEGDGDVCIDHDCRETPYPHQYPRWEPKPAPDDVGGLIANNLVSVQSLSTPAGLIFYLDYKYGNGDNGGELCDVPCPKMVALEEANATLRSRVAELEKAHPAWHDNCAHRVPEQCEECMVGDTERELRSQLEKARELLAELQAENEKLSLREALDDVREGRTCGPYDSVDEMMEDIVSPEDEARFERRWDRDWRTNQLRKQLEQANERVAELTANLARIRPVYEAAVTWAHERKKNPAAWHELQLLAAIEKAEAEEGK